MHHYAKLGRKQELNLVYGIMYIYVSVLVWGCKYTDKRMCMYTLAFIISYFSYFPFFLIHVFCIEMLLTPNGKSVTEIETRYSSYSTGLYQQTLEEVSLQTKSKMTPVMKILIQFESTAVSEWCIIHRHMGSEEQIQGDLG